MSWLLVGHFQEHFQDYDAFDLANEDDVLEEFLGLERRYAKVGLVSFSSNSPPWPGDSYQDRGTGKGGGQTRGWEIGLAREEEGAASATSQEKVLRSGGVLRRADQPGGGGAGGADPPLARRRAHGDRLEGCEDLAGEDQLCQVRSQRKGGER